MCRVVLGKPIDVNLIGITGVTNQSVSFATPVQSWSQTVTATLEVEERSFGEVPYLTSKSAGAEVRAQTSIELAVGFQAWGHGSSSLGQRKCLFEQAFEERRL